MPGHLGSAGGGDGRDVDGDPRQATNWNDFLWPVYVLFNPESQTILPGPFLLQGSYNTNYAVIVAGGVASIPVLILFFVAQRYVIEGVSRSGLKG